jgi:tetraacyldisaccharide 4'-kinase
VNVKQTLVWPLTLPYGSAARLRARAYEMGLLRAKGLEASVISVGNLTVGGTGKTPMVIWIAQRLLAEGKKTGILTRGYRGTDGPDGPTSDEVDLMKFRLGDKVKFGVGANRYRQGKRLVAEGVEWIVLDDGFQHMQLARDANIVLIDAMNPFGGGRLLPAGFMREPKTALHRADVIVITRSERAPAVEASVRRETNAPIFYARPKLEYLQAISGGSLSGIAPTPQARPMKWFAFCGIGNPAAFVADLHGWNIDLVGHRFFRDHHRYTQAEIDDMAAEAQRLGGDGLLCTEKDSINLGDVKEFPIHVLYCHMEMQVDGGDEFWRTIETLVAISKSKPKK